MTSHANVSRPRHSRAAPPAVAPTDRTRRTVEAMAAFGVPEEQIAAANGLSRAMLRRQLGRELDSGQAKANAKVAECLYRQAINGNVTAQIWWTKARMKWHETTVQKHGGDGSGVPIRVEHGAREVLMARIEAMAASLESDRVKETPAAAMPPGADTR